MWNYMFQTFIYNHWNHSDFEQSNYKYFPHNKLKERKIKQNILFISAYDDW